MQLLYLGRSRLQRNRANLLQTLRMVAAFESLGIPTTLHLPPWPSSLRVRDRLRDFGIDTRLDIRSSQWLHSRWKGRPFVWFNRSLLRRADAVYVRSPELSLALCRNAVPHYLEIHDYEALAQDQIETIVEAHRIGLIRWLLPISQAAAQALQSAGTLSERMLVARSGVDLKAFVAVPTYRPPIDELPHVVYPGRLSRDRGLGLFEILAERGIAEITLLGEQEDAPKVLARLRTLPFVPHREIPTWFGRADLVLLPYQHALQHSASISPIKLFEAMAAGRPIVASNLPAIREILTHEENALLVPPDDTEAWIAAVQRLRTDPELACRLARAAREKAQDYSWEKRAEGIARACGWLT